MSLTFKQYLVESRYYQDRDMYDCPDCKGKGHQTFWYQHTLGHIMKKCETCGGKKQLTKPEYLKHRAIHDYDD